jgi:hypothetical protein
MDAIQFLKQEHERAKRAFATLLGTPPAERGARWSELVPELKVHEKIEEQCLYGPIARDGASDPALSAWVTDRHQDEVHEVEGLIEEMESLDPEDERWLLTVRQIKAALDITSSRRRRTSSRGSVGSGTSTASRRSGGR